MRVCKGSMFGGNVVKTMIATGSSATEKKAIVTKAMALLVAEYLEEIATEILK